MPLMNSPALVEKLENAWHFDGIDFSVCAGVVAP